MNETVSVRIRAHDSASLPPLSPSTVAGIPLPLGGLVTADHEYSDDPAAPIVRAWISAVPIDDPTELWWRLVAAFAETGLWPLVVQTLHDEGEPGRPWITGELSDPMEPARQAEEFFTARIDGKDADPEVHGRYPGGFPGLAAAQRPQSDTVTLPRLELAPGRLLLVPTTRPADVFSRLGWRGADDWHPVGDLTAVLRSWEDRFGTVPVLAGFRTLGTLSEAVPAGGDDLTRLVAEHWALSPDQVGQGTDDLDAYARTIAGTLNWTFGWA